MAIIRLPACKTHIKQGAKLSAHSTFYDVDFHQRVFMYAMSSSTLPWG